MDGVSKKKAWGSVQSRESNSRRMKWQCSKHRHVKKEAPAGQPWGGSSAALPGHRHTWVPLKCLGR